MWSNEYILVTKAWNRIKIKDEDEADEYERLLFGVCYAC